MTRVSHQLSFRLLPVFFQTSIFIYIYNCREQLFLSFIVLYHKSQMSSPYAYPEQPSAPPMYPAAADHIRPVPPVRSEFNRYAHEEALLAPKVPPRMDIPADHARPISRRSLANAVDEGLRRVSILRILNCDRLEKRNSIASHTRTHSHSSLTFWSICLCFFWFCLGWWGGNNWRTKCKSYNA